jgi:hypothetical protein
VTLVQTKTGGSNPVPTITWTSNTTSGNLIIVLVGINSGAATVTGITDSQSNSYARIDSGGAGDGVNIYEFWYAYNITGGTTPTITTTTSAGAATQLIIREYSGIIGSSNPLIGHSTDRDSVLSSAASAGWASGPPNCLIVGGVVLIVPLGHLLLVQALAILLPKTGLRAVMQLDWRMPLEVPLLLLIREL